jgi:hypothetical protein
VICIVLVFVIVGLIDGQHLQNWNMPLQPNSLIAVSATFGKTAMLVQITSVISPLKWHHYHTTPQPLNHLELYDQASRGPLVSLMYAMKMKRLPLALGGALITLLA